MNRSRIATKFLHTSVESRTGRPLGASHLSDRDRLGVILQAAALLSHLETAGWRLVSAWQDLELDGQGVLRGARVQPGSDAESAHHKLVALVEVLFGDRNRIVGKGQAKRLASRFLQRWHRRQNRLPADRVVTHLLDEVGFLWQPRFSPGRRALVAELRGGQSGRLLVAGRGAFEKRLLARGCTRCELEGLVTQPSAGSLWQACASGGIREALVNSPLSRGRQLHFLGRWQESVELLADLPEPRASMLRADVLRLLGRPGSAKRLLESLFARIDLSPDESLEHAQAMVAVHLDLREPQLARSLLAQRHLGTSRRNRMGFDLLVAEVAAWCGDWQALGRQLSSLEDLRDDAQWSWRWNRLMMWWARGRRQLQEAENLAVQTIARGRRLIPRHEVADLWRNLASIRLERGDLVGAERAAGHALRLFDAIDELSAVATSRWLADLRLRQGRGLGVEQLLRSQGTDQVAPRFAGDPGTKELRARMDLAGGRPSRALNLLESAAEDQESLAPERRQRRRILSARALGWLGRGAEARALLNDAVELQHGHLEPEELPALWALAGDWSRARQSAGKDAAGQLWELALAGETIPAESWDGLNSLGAYRSARMVFDLQLVAPGKVPQHWIEKAAVVLRRAGAHSFAERLDRTREGSWQALETFLNSGVRRGRDFGDLFATAGYFDTRLEWRHRDTIQVLVPGHGGTRVLKAEKLGGELILSATSVDSIVKALFALAVREFEPDIGASDRAVSRVRGILGESDALHKALVRLERLAGSEVPVLILGETGTGKELAARQLHHLSTRASHPLVTVNCAALSESLLLSDLFGHVRGAFTGADRDRAGVFESACGGTVLLDEIGDLPPAAQGKLLRVLQEGEVRRVGESLPRQIDIRVVAATHRDLRSMVDERTFRADLFYRLKVGCLTLPPLRSRERDVLVLADRFIERSGHTLTSRARQRLLTHHWPGNVRELRNVLQVAMALSEDSTIDLADLELPISDSRCTLGYHQQVEEFRRELVRQALVASDGQRSAAARRLDVSRQALSYLVRRFGLQ